MTDERLTIVAAIQPLIDRAATEAAMVPAALMTHLIVGRLGAGADSDAHDAKRPAPAPIDTAIVSDAVRSRARRPDGAGGMPVRE